MLNEIQRNPDNSSPFLVRTKILVEENEELLPYHTIVIKTEWEIGTHYRLDFPQ